MAKKSLKIDKYINENIKVGDFVYIIDGSGLTSESLPDKDVYIIYSYPEIGILKKLEDIHFKVIEVGVTYRVSTSVCDRVLLQDIVVESTNGEKFRTLSGFVSFEKNSNCKHLNFL